MSIGAVTKTSTTSESRPEDRTSHDTTIQYGLAILTIVLVAAPLLPIIYQSLLATPLYESNHSLTLSNYQRLPASPGFWRMIGNTLAYAAMTTVIAQVLGTLAAILIGRTDMPGRRWLGEIFLFPLYLSALVLAFAWSTVYGPSGYFTQLIQTLAGYVPWNLYSIYGMSVISGSILAPVAYLYTISSASASDPRLEQAARIAGARRAKTLFTITLPLMRPAIIFSSILTFTSALEILSIPLVFGKISGVYVFSTYLADRFQMGSPPDYGVAASASILLIAVIVGLLALQSKLMGSTRRFETIGGKSSPQEPFQLGGFRWVCTGALFAYLTFVILIPMAFLFLRASVSLLHPMVPLSQVLTISNFQVLLDYPIYFRSITNSLMIALFGAAFATTLILLIWIVIQRSTFRYRGILRYIALLPRAIPGMVVGIGFFYAVALIPGLSHLRGTILILIVAYTMAAIPLGYGLLAPMLVKIGPDLDKAARVQGASWWQTTRTIIIPIIKPAYIACYALLFISFFKDYATSLFLYTTGSEVIGTTLLAFWTMGHFGYVAALSTVQVIVIALCVIITRTLLGIKLYS
jgi:iron(III) transport system permease protein